MIGYIKKLNKLEKLLLPLYLLVILCLFLYSFTQIDLSLTFSRIEVLRNAVGYFQHIGYFDRPLSTYLYLSIIVVLFVFYLWFLWLAKNKKIGKLFVWSTIIITAVILTFSYNAFSYDIFNYIFDAKIITHYHENPYQHKALDYQGDPMLSFMRWTHRVYPYGPVWLALTVPISFAGVQIFLLTFFLFKFLMAASFILCLYFIGKIFQKINPDRELFGLVFFGFSPLVIIESLVSAHVDIVMMCFALGALHLLINRQFVFSYLSLAISIGIKFVTVFMAPVYLLIHFYQYNHKKIPWGWIFGLFLVLAVAGVIAESSISNFQPWYLLAVLPFAVFAAHRYIVLIPSVIISLAALCNYVPFLYVGNWDKPIPQMLADLNFFSYCLSFLAVAINFFYKQIAYAQTHKKNKK